MSKARLVINAVVLEKRPVGQVAAAYGVSRSWVYELLARYGREGQAAFEPHSRRPRTIPTATPPATVELVLQLREQLTASGHDAGADTIRWHLQQHHRIVVSRATVHRILTRHGTVTAQPQKRPRSSWTRFEADQPNECWQSDFTHYRLTRPDGRPGPDVEIITWLDDHSRYALHVSAHTRVTARVVRDTFRAAYTEHGTPYSTLTDNGMVYTVRLASRRVRGGRNALEAELATLGVIQKNSRPNHPTTCGKVERFQQTLKKWLRAQPRQPATTTELQTLLERFRHEYNHQRPHRALPHRATPNTAYTARPKATVTTEPTARTHDRSRDDRVSKTGNVTLRHSGRLHHIGIGRAHAGTPIILQIEDLNIRVAHAITGELLRELTLDPTKDYQAQHPK
jgi:transposase InsO family protein